MVTSNKLTEAEPCDRWMSIALETSHPSYPKKLHQKVSFTVFIFLKKTRKQWLSVTKNASLLAGCIFSCISASSKIPDLPISWCFPRSQRNQGAYCFCCCSKIWILFSHIQVKCPYYQTVAVSWHPSANKTMWGTSMTFSLPHVGRCAETVEESSQRGHGCCFTCTKSKNTVSKISNARNSPLSIWGMKIQENAVHRSNSLNLKSSVL